MDYLIYPLHGAFWLSFLVTRLASRPRPAAGGDTQGPAVVEERTAPFSRAVLAFHMLAMGVLYFGLGNTVIPGRVPERFPLQRLAGALLMVAATALAAWAVASFRSWRLRAQLQVGHELATEGPFALVRHPIYLAMGLLAVGTALWVPDPIVLAGAALMAIGGDLRARSEERLLTAAFGDRYVAYLRRTSRFLPGVY